MNIRNWISFRKVLTHTRGFETIVASSWPVGLAGSIHSGVVHRRYEDDPQFNAVEIRLQILYPGVGPIIYFLDREFRRSIAILEDFEDGGTPIKG